MGSGLHVTIPLSTAYSWEAASRYIADTYCPAGGKIEAKPQLLKSQNESHATQESYSFDASTPRGVDHRALSRFLQWYFEEVEIYVEIQALCQAPETPALLSPTVKDQPAPAIVPDKKPPVEIHEPELAPILPEKLPALDPPSLPLPTRIEPIPPVKLPEAQKEKPVEKPVGKKPKPPVPEKSPDKKPEAPVTEEIPL